MRRQAQTAHLSELTGLVERALAPVVGGQAHCRLTGPLYIRDNSRIYRAVCSGLEGSLAVKFCVDHQTGKPDCNSAAEQFNSLDEVFAAMREDAFRVPRPYAADVGAGLLITEWIDGAPMTARLSSARCSSADAATLVASAAAWLRRFHGGRPLAPGPLDIDHKLRELDELASSPIGARGDVRAALSELRRRAAAAGDPCLPRSWIHGDFKSDNLLCAAGGTIGIDVHARHENSVFYDLAPFANHLDLLRCDPRTWRWAAQAQGMQRTFLASYFAGANYPLLPFLWLRMFLLLSVWNMTSSSWQAGSLKARLGNLCFQRSLRRLHSALSAA